MISRSHRQHAMKWIGWIGWLRWVGCFCAGTLLTGGCAMSMKQSVSSFRTQPLPAAVEQARIEVFQLQRWIQQHRYGSIASQERFAPPPPAAGKTSDSIGGYEPTQKSLRPFSSPPVPTSPSARMPSSAREDVQSVPTAAYRGRDHRNMRCQRICQASQGICAAGQRICRISQQFPIENAFRLACLRATEDCKVAQQQCRAC